MRDHRSVHGRLSAAGPGESLSNLAQILERDLIRGRVGRLGCHLGDDLGVQSEQLGTGEVE
jgi:hypothetical protein